MTSDPQSKAFAEYIRDRKILIADPSTSSRSNLHSVLTELGAKATQLTMVSTFEEARAMLERLRPEIIISEYTLDTGCGLDLMQRQRLQRPDTRTTLFILVTSDASETAVVRAAEEDVDGYILKPFTAQSLRETLLKHAMSKVQPSPYVQKIEEGKAAIEGSRFQDALALFSSALSLNSAPSLACYYIGKVHFLLSALDKAESAYRKGLQFNEIHYKCMTGLYEVLRAQKRVSEAYVVVKRLVHQFPVTPERLMDAVRLAVVSENFADMEGYYAAFKKLENRSTEITLHMCAALVVCGKHYFQVGDFGKGLVAMKNAGVSAAGRSRILREIILALLDNGLENEAPDFLKRFPSDQITGGEYRSLELMILDRTGASDSQIVEKGRKCVADGCDDPSMHEIMIRRAAKANLHRLGQELFDSACARHPGARDQFERALSGAASTSAPQTAVSKG